MRYIDHDVTISFSLILRVFLSSIIKLYKQNHAGCTLQHTLQQNITSTLCLSYTLSIPYGQFILKHKYKPYSGT